MGTEFQSGKMKKFDGGDGYTKMSMDLMSKKCTLINGYSGKGCVSVQTGWFQLWPI